MILISFISNDIENVIYDLDLDNGYGYATISILMLKIFDESISKPRELSF